MPNHNASPTPLPGQAGLRKPKGIGCEDGWWHTHEQNEISQLDGNLSDFEKAFLDEMDKKDLERKDEEAEKKMLEETHEQTITYIRTSLGTRIQDLIAERQVLQTTINSQDKLLVDFRRKHATEIKTLVGIKERLEVEVNTKSNEAAIVHGMYGVQIKRLIDERVVLQNQLNKAAFGALVRNVEVPKHTEAAVMGKSVAPLPQPSKANSKRVAHCTQCMTYNWECDGKTPCTNCSLRGIRPGCKWVMCKRYKRNVCPDRQCRFAHEEDEHKRKIPYDKAWGDGRRMSPVELDRLGLW